MGDLMSKKQLFTILLFLLLYACSGATPEPTPGPSPGPYPDPTCKGSVCIGHAYIKLQSNGDITIEFDLSPRNLKIDYLGNIEPAEDVSFKDVVPIMLYQPDTQDLLWGGEITPDTEYYSCYEAEDLSPTQQLITTRCGLELPISLFENAFEIGEHVRIEILEFRFDRTVVVQSI